MPEQNPIEKQDPHAGQVPDPAAPAPASPPGNAGEPLPPPPTFGKSLAQLVIIPALIAIACICAMFLFGLLAGRPDSVEDQLLRLQQSSGAGKMAMGLQDPRYKDRWMAASNLAQSIAGIKEPSKRRQVSDQLIHILDHNVQSDEDLLQNYLLMAIGQLGQEGGLEAIIARFQAPEERVRQGAIRGVLSWPDRQQARAALPALIAALGDSSDVVKAESAAAVGALAPAGDEQSLAGLKQALSQATGLAGREVQWNAAIALARLGDDQGSQFVVEVLFNRAALAKMPAGAAGAQAQIPMPTAIQDRVILSALASAPAMNSPLVWEKVHQLADQDPSRSVQNAARQLWSQRQKESAAGDRL